MSDNPQSRTDRYRAAILDMDGTLIDSNAAHVKAWVDVLREFGHEVSEQDIWPCIGMGGDNLLPAVRSSPSAAAASRTRI
ncbi:MAG: HAD hydrolase-like protein [Thermoanaerobaculia bacterium]